MVTFFRIFLQCEISRFLTFFSAGGPSSPVTVSHDLEQNRVEGAWQSNHLAAHWPDRNLTNKMTSSKSPEYFAPALEKSGPFFNKGGAYNPCGEEHRDESESLAVCLVHASESCYDLFLYTTVDER
jgi:hypothetical protein